MFLWLDTTSEGSTSGGTQSPLRSAGAPCDVIARKNGMVYPTYQPNYEFNGATF